MFVMAAASLLTEMILAQLATVLWGGLIAKYTLTLGVFILALGLGSLIQIRRDQASSLAWQQLIMVGLSIISPWMVLWAGTHLVSWASWSIAALSIFSVGFFCGLEFPLLAALAAEEYQTNFTNKFENKPKLVSAAIFSQLLRMDYLGMGLSSFLFPVFLLKHLGVFQASLLAALFNWLVAFSIYLHYHKAISSAKQKVVFFGILILSGAVITALYLSADELTSAAQQWIVQ